MKSRAIWIERDETGYWISGDKMHWNYIELRALGITLKIGEQVRVKLVKVGDK